MNQAQSESLLSLLLLAIFVDKKLTLKESDAFDIASKSLEWHSFKPKDDFILKSFREARDASHTEIATQAYLVSKLTPFQEPSSQDQLLKTLQSILACDGLVECEKAFLSTVETALQA